MRVDVVAAPMRYRRTPLVLLLVIALVPALALAVAVRWLDDEADRYESSRESVGGPELDTELAVDEVELTAAELEAEERRAVLSTSLFDYRRVPQPIVDRANAKQLGVAVAPLYGFLNENSCVAVSVNGAAATSFNEDRAVIPASTLKIAVGAVALEVLGADYTFETTVRVPLASDGVVDGDVFLVGGGDPLLTSVDYPIDACPSPHPLVTRTLRLPSSRTSSRAAASAGLSSTPPRPSTRESLTISASYGPASLNATPSPQPSTTNSSS